MTTWKHLIRRGINSVGLDVHRLSQSPTRTLLGLARRPFRCVIDCGANEGQFARLISEFFPQARLYCFEPLPEPHDTLAAWAATQGDRVKCFQVALGDREGEVQMHQHTNHTPSSSLLSSTKRCHELYPQTRAETTTSVKMTTLDQALASEMSRMPRDILLKLDVQGYEDRVLRGANRLLQMVSACILEVCLDPLYEGQADFQTLTTLLYANGLRYAGNLDQSYGEDGHAIFIDSVFLR